MHVQIVGSERVFGTGVRIKVNKQKHMHVHEIVRTVNFGRWIALAAANANCIKCET